MRFTTLHDWLAWQETLHPAEIELGLERVAAVHQQLHAGEPPFIVITVAGTNGKGSSVAMLEAILLAAGYRVGTYTSPHLQRYNERIRLNGETVTDNELIQAFARIDEARGNLSLTYFEFGTLAALDIFYRNAPDVVILEVGLGGRLDAVNVVDPDIAIITSISLDHTSWLGPDRESIAREKAGIMRPGRPVVFSGSSMPDTIASSAQQTGAILFALGKDFQYMVDGHNWQFQGSSQPAITLALPALQGEHQLQNASGVLEALQLLADRLPVNQHAIHAGLRKVSLPGRFQILPGEVNWVLDVAHNPDSMARLASLLSEASGQGQTLVVIGMLQDKDISAMIRILQFQVDRWFSATLPSSRSISAEKLAEMIKNETDCAEVRVCDDVTAACDAARAIAQPGDRIVVCGSFYTVAEAMAQSL